MSVKKFTIKRINLFSEHEEGWVGKIRVRINKEGKVLSSYFDIRNLREQSNKNYKANKKKCLKRGRHYKFNNRERCCELENRRRKRNPQKFKIANALNNSKHREFGFNPLNKPIDGIECDGHHINKDDVVYIFQKYFIEEFLTI